MTRSIKSMEEQYLLPALDLVEQVFTDHENAEEGKLVRTLVQEIRAGRFYLPQLELVMVNEANQLIGYVMFSRFHLDGNFENELLILTPCAVRTDMQRRHISKELIEHGFEKAAEMGYKAIIVEGNPQNYRARGFVTAANHGIVPSENLHLPHIDCLMVKELVPGGLEHIRGRVDYADYQCLT